MSRVVLEALAASVRDRAVVALYRGSTHRIGRIEHDQVLRDNTNAEWRTLQCWDIWKVDGTATV